MKSTPKRRNVLQAAVGVGSFLLIGGAGTASARGPPSSRDTLVDIAQRDEDFNILVAAVEKAGLVDALSGNRQLTVFAPTDEAFANLADNLGVEVDDLLELDNLADILLYHVTSGRRNATSVVNAPRVSMLNGESVTVDGTTLNGGQAEIISPDITASNGIIHVLDGVLLPPE